MDGETAIAPGAITELARDDHVMQRVALALWRGRHFAGGAVHARQPPFRDDDGLGDLVEIDDTKTMIGEAVEMRRDIGIAPAHPGQPVDAKPGHFEKRDLLHLAGPGDVVDRKTAAEAFALGDAVGEG